MTETVTLTVIGTIIVLSLIRWACWPYRARWYATRDKHLALELRIKALHMEPDSPANEEEYDRLAKEQESLCIDVSHSCREWVREVNALTRPYWIEDAWGDPPARSEGVRQELRACVAGLLRLAATLLDPDPDPTRIRLGSLTQMTDTEQAELAYVSERLGVILREIQS